jgi:hypothetical protein
MDFDIPQILLLHGLSFLTLWLKPTPVQIWLKMNIFCQTYWRSSQSHCNYYQVEPTVKCEHKDISNSTETKFLGLIIYETLSWNQHIDQIAIKLCSACYALRNLKHTVPQSTLRTIYYAYIHSILSYGIIFLDRASNANKLFILQKKIVRNITNTRVRESCRGAFKNMQIMTLYSQYIFSLILFTTKN